MTDTPPRSFIKSLFSGGFEEDLVFPYPEVDPEEADTVALFKNAVEKYAQDHIDSAAIDEEGRLPEDVLTSLAEIGIFGLNIPEEYGGSGLSQTGYSKMAEIMAGVDFSVALTVGAHQSIGLKGILLFGTEEQKKKFLPRLAKGELIAGFALTEPGAGSDAASIQTKADYIPEEDAYLINGSKLWVTNGGIGSLFTTFGRMAVTVNGKKKDRITAFIVTRDMEGFSSGPEERKLGIHGSSTAGLFFENMHVPAGHVLGEKGMGFKVAMEVLNSGRLGLAAGSIGGMRKVIAESTAHALRRRQFGKAIAEFELIEEKIARMAMGAFVIDAMTYLTTGMVDRGGIDYSVESAICKVASSEASWRTVNDAVQIAAGVGYMKEYPYERFLRDARINMIFEGTNEILRIFIALAGAQGPGEYLKKIGKAMRDPIKGFGLLTDYAIHAIKQRVTTPEITKAHKVLEPEVQRLREYVKEFQGTVEAELMRHGKEIVEREFIQQRIANIAIDLYAMTATISKVTTLIDSRGEEGSEAEIQVCRLFCDQAWRRIRRNVRMTRSNSDELVRTIAKHVYDHEGYALG